MELMVSFQYLLGKLFIICWEGMCEGWGIGWVKGWRLVGLGEIYFRLIFSRFRFSFGRRSLTGAVRSLAGKMIGRILFHLNN